MSVNRTIGPLVTLNRPLYVHLSSLNDIYYILKYHLEILLCSFNANFAWDFTAVYYYLRNRSALEVNVE